MGDPRSMGDILSSFLRDNPSARAGIDEPDVDHLVMLPKTTTLQKQLERHQAQLAEARKQVVTRQSKARIETLTKTIAGAEKDLALGKHRDELQAARPDDCICLGTGGRGESYVEVPTGYEQVAWTAAAIDEEGSHGRVISEQVPVPRELCPSPLCEEGKAARVRRDEARQRRERYFVRRKLSRLWNDDTVPRRYQEQTFETWVERVVVCGGDRRWAERMRDELLAWIDSGRWLILYGPKGCGKTSLCVSLLRVMADRNIPVLFQPIDALLQRVKDCYGSHASASESEILKSICEIDRVGVDDVGAEQDTEWTQKTMGRIVNARYNDLKPLILTTNLNPYTDFTPRLGPRTTDRLLEESVVLEVNGPSLRDERPAF